MTSQYPTEAENPTAQVTEEEATQRGDEYAHVYGKQKDNRGVFCETDTRGHATPGGRSPLELMIDASEGFIPLWAHDVTLRWRFQPQSMAIFVNPDAAAGYLRTLFGEALLLWTPDAVPIRFTEAQDVWDFEIAVNAKEKCSINGCTLASAFFPDSGRHELKIYPTMFDQDRAEQIETMAHELGHVFGLRHFFAKLRESGWAAELFGKHNPLSIMNYGEESRMTPEDQDDLALLYQKARSGELTNINGTPIQLFRPFSGSRLGGADPVCIPATAASQAAS